MPGFGVDFANEIHRSSPRAQLADIKGAAPTESARPKGADCDGTNEAIAQREDESQIQNDSQGFC